MTHVIDGNAIAKKVKDEVKAEIAELKRQHAPQCWQPKVAVILIGDDPGSKIYVAGKEKDCKEVGILSETHVLPTDTEEEELLALIEKLNRDKSVHGILVQLPLPDHLNESKILEHVAQFKDVDCFHPINVGKLTLDEPYLLPCTPAGVIRLIEETGVKLEGKKAVVVGRGRIVGKPLFHMLLAKHCTVTVCHSRTKDLTKELNDADIVVAAVGKKHIIKKDMLKDGAIVIDVGITRDEHGKICGDVDFENAQQVCSYITPVPGGVGPMTRAMLMRNIVSAAKHQQKK